LNITTKTGLVGFFLAISALNQSPSHSSVNQATTEKTQPSIEQRLARISSLIRAQENQLQDSPEAKPDGAISYGWGKRYGGGGWANGGGGGFLNRRWPNGWGNGGGFANRGWPNGWADGGGFFNRSW
jgi:rSAM-associated Gly-rich repeat protein